MTQDQAVYSTGELSASEILAKLEEAYSERDVLNLEQARLLDEAMPQEVKARIAEIGAEFLPMHQAVDEKIAALEEQAKQAVIRSGQTIKSKYIQAVYSKGRVTWDSKKLEGLMMIVPQLEGARKVGEPTVRLQKVGKGE